MVNASVGSEQFSRPRLRYRGKHVTRLSGGVGRGKRLVKTVGKIPGNYLFTAWVIISLSVMFSVLLWSPSPGARLNLLDGILSMPALILLPLLTLKGKLVSRPSLMAAGVLVLYLAYGLISSLWAESPDVSKSVRAGGQILGLYAFFSCLYLSGREDILKLGLFIGCCVGALVCLWHLIGMYILLGAPLGQALYSGFSGAELNGVGVMPINMMHATLLAAPQAAMLVGLLRERRGMVYRVAGVAALAVLALFLAALERRTGQVALLVTFIVAAFVYRSRVWFVLLFVLCGVAVAVFLLHPEIVLSRGASWRPEIWLATLDKIAEKPLFGHGLSNVVEPVAVYGDNGHLLETFRHPHSMWLSVTYSLGIAGVILWGLLWVPGLIARLFFTADRAGQGYITIPLIVGAAMLLLDGGAAMATFHYHWFCFWVPVTLLLASFYRAGDQMPQQCSKRSVSR